MKAIQQFENIYGIRITGKKHMQLLAMMLCIEIVLAFSYLGFIELPPISVTTLHIFVIVAAMLFGPWDAAAVAAVFGVSSMWKASVTAMEIGDLIFSPFMSGKPLASVVMALGTRVAFAVAAGYLFRWFFSRERKHYIVGISAISIFVTLLHSMLVYVCMAGFFGAADVETSSSFDHNLFVSNLLLYAITLLVVILCYRVFQFASVRTFLQKTCLEEGELTGKKSRFTVILYVVLALLTAFIAMHFMTRLGGFIVRYGGDVSDEYISWTYSLVMQFILGFVGVFGILSIVVRWVREYYSALAMEANNQARENAEIANKSKTAFLFNMSHDIRTPMNAILGYTDIAMRHSDEPERVNDSLKKIKTSGDHLLSLINDILEMSRIEAGKLEVSENPMDIREAIDNVTSMARSLAIPKSIEFNVTLGTIKNPYIYADELHANEVLINLISNAVKYTDKGGRIIYCAEQLGDAEGGIARFRFTVQDTGIGMSEEFQEHLFEAFSREESATVAKQEGAGLGLSIVKQIVDQAGGTISVQSKLGVGSIFCVEVPLRVMSEEEIEAFLKESEKETAGCEDTVLEGRLVLVVEDNEMNREIASDILENAGLTVEAAEDGEIAVRKVEEKGADYYDFILMDIQMPVMDGYEATRRIRSLPGGNSVPIIALSANAFKEDVDKSLDVGMNAHVAKPIDVRTLLDTMHSLAR